MTLSEREVAHEVESTVSRSRIVSDVGRGRSRARTVIFGGRCPPGVGRPGHGRPRRRTGWPTFPGGGRAALRVRRGPDGRLRGELVLDLPIPGREGGHPGPLHLRPARADCPGFTRIQAWRWHHRAVPGQEPWCGAA